MKRIFAILLAMMLAIALFAGCGTKDSSGETASQTRTTMAGSVTVAPKESQPPSSELGPLTKDIFAVYTAGGTYHVKYMGPMAGGGTSMDDIYAKGENLAMMAPGEEYNRILIKDEYYYQVNDDKKTVIKTPLEDIAGYPIPPDPTAMRFVGSGKADFKGKELDYDEYYYADGLRPENDFQAFYFIKDGVLRGIRHTWEVEGGGAKAGTEVEYLVFEAEVHDSVFDIPADYTVTEN